MLGSEVRGTAGGGRGRRGALSRDGTDTTASSKHRRQSPRTAQDRREEMNHKRATARGTRKRVDRGPGGPANQRRQWARAVCVLAPVLVARAPGYLRHEPTAGPRRGHTQLTRLAPAPPPPHLPPKAWTDQRRGRHKAQTEIGCDATKTNSLPPSHSHCPHRPDRRRPRPSCLHCRQGTVRDSVRNHQQTNLPQERDGGNKTASQIDDGLVGVGPWH